MKISFVIIAFVFEAFGGKVILSVPVYHNLLRNIDH